MVLEQNNCQKQLLADVLQNRCFLKFRNMHRKEKIIKRLLYGWFPVNIANFYRAASLWNNYFYALLIHKAHQVRIF